MSLAGSWKVMCLITLMTLGFFFFFFFWYFFCKNKFTSERAQIMVENTKHIDC